MKRLDAGRLVALGMAAVVVAFGAASLDQYNVTWDEALGDLFFGERYLSYFTSFDPDYLDFHGNPYPPERRPDLGLSPFRSRPWEYYPVANVLAAATAEILGRRLGWVDVFDGFHALNLLLAALLIVVFHRFLHRRYGLLAATAAIAFLFGHPRVIFHMMANVKDFPLMVLWTLAACAFVVAWERGSARGLLGCAALLGLALGTKANALFFPLLPAVVLLLGGLPDAWKEATRRGSAWLRLGLAVAGSAIVSLGLMVAAWPYLWADPAGRFARHLEYVGTRKSFTSAESMAPILEALLFTTPPILLLGVVLGLGWLSRRVRRSPRREWRSVDLLWPAWIVASLGRYLLPRAVNFDGVRHFLEVMPAFAALAGVGTAATARWMAGRLRAARSLSAATRRRIAAALVVLALLPGAWAVLRTHPFQACYWNVFAGGYDGARERGLPQAADYWAASYRLGLRWLNENAARDAYLAVPVVEHAVRLVAPERLRPDLRLLPVTTPFSPRIAPERLAATRRLADEAEETGRPVYVMFVERRDWANELMLDCLRHLEPEIVWALEDAPVLSIYRYSPPPGWTSD